MIALWASLSFLLGALPFAVWIGRYGLNVDIRQYGDGNPGATNVLRAGGRGWYAFALALDISKGAIPVGIANNLFGLSGWPLVLIAIMPPLGHAFSPFLNGNGGKALAAAAGVWFGLWTPYFVVGVIGLVAFSLIVRPSGYAVFGTMFLILGVGVWFSAETSFYLIWLAQVVLFLWKQRDDLKQRPGLYFGRTAKRNQTDSNT